jgi:glycosidase
VPAFLTRLLAGAQGDPSAGHDADPRLSPVNGVSMQSFQWYNPSDGTLWNEFRERVPELAAHSFTAVWLPPSKGQGGCNDVGYGVYALLDLVFDLGEFLQKGAARTKYGTREELLAAISAVQDHRMHAYADVVFNHMDGGDSTEEHAKRIHRREGKGDSHRLSRRERATMT